MMKYKLYKSIFLLAIAGLFIGCEGTDLNGLDPINSVPGDGAINNFKSATAAMNGVYDELQMTTTNHLDAFLDLAQIYSDEADFTGTFPTRFEFMNLSIQTANGTNANVFTEFYDVINTANNVLEILPTVEDPGLTDAVVNNFLGQARMARALSYFFLSEYYGDIPLILTPTREVGEVLNVANSSKSDIRAQMIDDLKFAESNITETNTKRFTSQAASALLARIYLYMENWGDALSHAEKVLGAGFDLTSVPYLQDEIMFLGFTTADGNVLNFWYGPSECGGRHDVEPSAKFIGSYEDGDLRKAMSIVEVGEPMAPCGIADPATVPFVIKYPTFSAGISGSAPDPILLFRHAEQVLIAAEAAARSNDFVKANSYYNQVRARAGLADQTLDAGNYIDLILQERLIELSFEGPHRYFDLRRTGKAAQEIPGYQPCNDIWPIPQREIDRNPNLQQNNCCNC
jgi:hypothetical protein